MPTHPVFRSIAESIRAQIVSGAMLPGEKLPAIRKQADEMGVSADTVYKAYEVLKSEGLLISRMGSGVQVASPLPGRQAMDYLVQSIRRGCNPIYETVSAVSTVRSLASNVADPGLFPADEFLADMGELRRSSSWAFYYSPGEGDLALREQIASWLVAMGTPATPSNLVVTMGSQQALAMVARYLLPPATKVVIEGGDRLDGSRAWRLVGHERVVSPRLPGDRFNAEGIRSHRPGAVYVAPTGCPATGRVMTLAERQDLISVAQETGSLVVEDASLSWMPYGQRPVDVAALGPGVVQVGSFSYCLAPGLRIGYILTSPEHARKLAASQLDETGSVPLPIQIGLGKFIRAGRLAGTIRRNTPKYQSRRAAAVAALRLYMPRGVTHTTNGSGFGIRLDLPAEVDMRALYEQSINRGVAFTPGDLLFHPSEASRALRVCFGIHTEAALTEAVKTLAVLVTKAIA